MAIARRRTLPATKTWSAFAGTCPHGGGKEVTDLDNVEQFQEDLPALRAGL